MYVSFVNGPAPLRQIPFAKPPLGDLRFKKPVPIDPWQGVYDAHNLPNSCQQERYDVFPGFRGEEMWNPNTPISEDCLYLNLWVPTKLRRPTSNNNGTNNNSLGTVLIWIYGGGYMSGTSTLEVYDALILAATDEIIVASFNYRVGAFGFLYLDDEDAPGNMGLYDQALAIKWIKDNIRSFGGDPNSLTLFGESAGAGSVSVHLLSPISGHLARRAIMQSGSVNAPWSYMTAETSKRIAVALVNDVGCNASLVGLDTRAVMECMRSVEAKNLSLIQWNSYWGILGFPSAPTIDGVFLPKHPKDMLKEGGFGDAEILVGTNQDEGNQINSIYSVRSQGERVDFSRPENRRRWEGNRLRPVRLVYLMFIFSFFFFLFPPHTQGRTLSSTTLFSTLRRTIPAYWRGKSFWRSLTPYSKLGRSWREKPSSSR